MVNPKVTHASIEVSDHVSDILTATDKLYPLGSLPGSYWVSIDRLTVVVDERITIGSVLAWLIGHPRVERVFVNNKNGLTSRSIRTSSLVEVYSRPEIWDRPLSWYMKEQNRQEPVPVEDGLEDLYEHILASLELNGFRPKGFYISEDSGIYLSVGDASRIMKVSRGRVHQLVEEDRIGEVKVGRGTSFVSAPVAVEYQESGRKPHNGGRPRKSGDLLET